jgi:hypothetical protein
MDEKGRSRIYLDVTPDIADRAFRLIPWGWRNQIMHSVLDQLLTAIEQEGLEVAAMLISGKLRLFGREE